MDSEVVRKLILVARSVDADPDTAKLKPGYIYLSRNIPVIKLTLSLIAWSAPWTTKSGRANTEYIVYKNYNSL